MVIQKPDNVSQKAQDLLDLGDEDRALEVMADFICSKRLHAWQQRGHQKGDQYESMMKQFLRLCVKKKNIQYGKDGLYQYRTLMQQINLKSFENVILYFLKLAEDQTDEVEEQHELFRDVEDLETAQVSDTQLIIAAFSGAEKPSAYQLHHEHMLPAVRFRWEVYRHCLELLKNNKNMEDLYHKIVGFGFAFCVKYDRKAEFKKLCKLLRDHLILTNKYALQQHSVRLTDKASFKAHLDDRLLQLDKAMELGLWQEAFRAIEDIWYLLVPNLKTPTLPFAILEPFCRKAASVFWNSKNPLFHSAIFHKILQLNRLHSGKSAAAQAASAATSSLLQNLNNDVLASTLAVPLVSIDQWFVPLIDVDTTSSVDQHRELSDMFELPFVPSRELLVKEITSKQILQNAHPSLIALFEALETDALNPLTLKAILKDALEYLAADDSLQKYITPIKEVATIRCLESLGKIYKTISLKSIEDMVSFMTRQELIACVIQTNRYRGVSITIDHSKNLVLFKESPDSSRDMENASRTLSWAIDRVNATNVQSKDSIEQLLIAAFKQYQAKAADMHMLRKQLTNERKDREKSIKTDRENRANELKRNLEEKARREEQERDDRMAKYRVEQQKREINETIAKNKIETIVARRPELKQFADMSAEELQTKENELIEKTLKAKHEKLRVLEKKNDYWVRAKRQAEANKVKAMAEDIMRQDKEEWEQAVDKMKKICEADIKNKLEKKDRFTRMIGDRDKFLEELRATRKKEYEKALEEFKKRCAAIRSERLAERKEKRLEEQRKKLEEEKLAALARERELLAATAENARPYRVGGFRESHPVVAPVGGGGGRFSGLGDSTGAELQAAKAAFAASSSTPSGAAPYRPKFSANQPPAVAPTPVSSRFNALAASDGPPQPAAPMSSRFGSVVNKPQPGPPVGNPVQSRFSNLGPTPGGQPAVAPRFVDVTSGAAAAQASQQAAPPVSNRWAGLHTQAQQQQPQQPPQPSSRFSNM